MVEFLGAAENIAFVVALGVVLLIGMVEAVGLGSSAIDVDFDAAWLSWLGAGKLPLLVLIALLLALFGMIGLLGQQIARDIAGTLLSPWIAVPAAGAAAILLTSLLSPPLARILPQDETSAIPVATLVGRHASIVVGQAAIGSPARARVRDHHGQDHYVMVEPSSATESFAEGDEILIVGRENGIFRAVGSDRRGFSNWIQS